MKRVLALALAMVMALSLAGGGSGDTSTGDSGSSGGNVVRIGVFEPATGDSGPGGKQEMLGMQYANKETPTVDIGGTTYNVELVYADNGSTTDKAPTAAAELVSKDVSLVLGSYGSSVAMAGGPVFDEAGPAAIGAPRGRLRQSASSRECAPLAHKKRNGTQLVQKLRTVSLFLTFLTAVRPRRSRSSVCFLHVFHILENITEIKCSEVVLRSLRPADHLDTAVFLEKKLRAL